MKKLQFNLTTNYLKIKKMSRYQLTGIYELLHKKKILEKKLNFSNKLYSIYLFQQKIEKQIL